MFTHTVQIDTKYLSVLLHRVCNRLWWRRSCVSGFVATQCTFGIWGWLISLSTTTPLTNIVSSSFPPSFPSILINSKSTSFLSKSATDRTASTAISAIFLWHLLTLKTNKEKSYHDQAVTQTGRSWAHQINHLATKQLHLPYSLYRLQGDPACMSCITKNVYKLLRVTFLTPWKYLLNAKSVYWSSTYQKRP